MYCSSCKRRGRACCGCRSLPAWVEFSLPQHRNSSPLIPSHKLVNQHFLTNCIYQLHSCAPGRMLSANILRGKNNGKGGMEWPILEGPKVWKNTSSIQLLFCGNVQATMHRHYIILNAVWKKRPWVTAGSFLEWGRVCFLLKARERKKKAIIYYYSSMGLKV